MNLLAKKPQPKRLHQEVKAHKDVDHHCPTEQGVTAKTALQEAAAKLLSPTEAHAKLVSSSRRRQQQNKLPHKEVWTDMIPSAKELRPKLCEKPSHTKAQISQVYLAKP